MFGWWKKKLGYLSLKKKKTEDANILKIPEVQQLCREVAQESVALAEADIVNSVLHLHSHPHMNIIKLKKNPEMNIKFKYASENWRLWSHDHDSRIFIT